MEKVLAICTQIAITEKSAMLLSPPPTPALFIYYLTRYRNQVEMTLSGLSVKLEEHVYQWVGFIVANI